MFQLRKEPIFSWELPPPDRENTPSFQKIPREGVHFTSRHDLSMTHQMTANSATTCEFDEQQEEYWRSRTNIRVCDHPAVQLFAQRRAAFLQQKLRIQYRTALDVGCGDGFGMRHMQGIAADIHGCDISPAMLSANPSPPEKLRQASAYELPYENGQFELVYCWELLHHVADPLLAVKEMCRVASKTVLLCEPNCLNPAMALFGVLYREERGTLRFTPRYLRRLLKKSGLNEVQHYTVGTFTPNRTPLPLAHLLNRLPYRWPAIGLYQIGFGNVDQ